MAFDSLCLHLNAGKSAEKQILNFMPIRLVSFDALHTLIAPRLPIHIQYSQTFAPFLGYLDPNDISRSFKTALKAVQRERPAYSGKSGADGWWEEIIQRTAIGAGADPRSVELSLPEVVPRLLQRFSSREGYKLFDDSLPILERLKQMHIRTALVSNTDARMRAVLQDLDILHYFDPVLLSGEIGIEKPSSDIFIRACRDVPPPQCMHVGDSLQSDYQGARKTGMRALLLRRHGVDGEGEEKEPSEDLEGVDMIDNLHAVLDHVRL